MHDGDLLRLGALGDDRRYTTGDELCLSAFTAALQKLERALGRHRLRALLHEPAFDVVQRSRLVVLVVRRKDDLVRGERLEVLIRPGTGRERIARRLVRE